MPSALHLSNLNRLEAYLTISFAEYLSSVSDLLLPSSVIGTSDDPRQDCVWQEGKRRDARATYWLLRTDDPTKVKRATVRVSFDKPVDFPNRRLSHPDFYHDALTRRIVCIEALNQNATPRQCGAIYTSKLLASFDWLLRWRNARSIASFKQMVEDDYQRFELDVLASLDIVKLLPLEERLERLLADKSFRLPLYLHGQKYRMHWDQFAATLGLNHFALARSKYFKDLFSARLPDFLEKSQIRSDDQEIYLRNRELTEKNEREEIRWPVWDALDRLAIGGFIQHDPLAFKVPSRIRTSQNGKRTTTLLPFDLMRVLSLCASWVVDYRHHILHALRERAELKTGKRSRQGTPLINALSDRLNDVRPDGLLPLALSVNAPNFESGYISLGRAVAFLFVASAILVGGLGARRSGEVNSLQQGSLKRTPAGLTLDMYIEKTLRDIDPVVVPDIIEQVVYCLEELSAEAREKHKDKWLIQFSAEFADGQRLPVNMRFSNLLSEFLNICGLTPPAGHETWELNFHMLRKGFVIAYYHGNLWGSFDGASRMLRHSSGDMTRIYMDDHNVGAILWLRNEVMRLTKIAISHRSKEEDDFLVAAKSSLANHHRQKLDWDEGRQEFFISKMMETFDGSELPIGKGAARMYDELSIMEERAHARIQFAAVPTNSGAGVRDNVLEQVTKAALDHFMEPIPGGFGYCMFKRRVSEHAALANCLKDRSAAGSPWQVYADTGVDIRPDYAFSGLHPCLSCELCTLFNANQYNLKAMASEMIEEQTEKATPSIATSAQSYVDDIFSLIKEAENVVEGKRRPR